MIDLMPDTLKSSRLICPMAKRLEGGARRFRASNAFIQAARDQQSRDNRHMSCTNRV
jgi:hypothetical protein